MRAVDERERMLAQLIEEHAPARTADDVLRQARIAHGSTMSFHIGSMRTMQTKPSLVRLQYATGGVATSSQTAAAERAAKGKDRDRMEEEVDEDAELLQRDLPKQITIKPAIRFGSLALTGSVASGSAAAAASTAYSLLSGSGHGGAGMEGSGTEGEGSEDAASNRWTVSSFPTRFNWGAAGGADAPATTGPDGAAAALPPPPSAAARAAARADNALRQQQQRRARRMSAMDAPLSYGAGTPGGTISTDGTGGDLPSRSAASCSAGVRASGDGTPRGAADADAPRRFQMHLSQLLGGASSPADAAAAPSALVASSSKAQVLARRSLDVPRRFMPNAPGMAGVGGALGSSVSRGFSADSDEAGPLTVMRSADSFTAQQHRVHRSPIQQLHQQQQQQQQPRGYRHSIEGSGVGGGQALRPTPLAVPPAGQPSPGRPGLALSPAGCGSPAMPSPNGGGGGAAAAAPSPSTGGGGAVPQDASAAAALARLTRISRVPLRPEPQQLWTVDSQTVAAHTSGVDANFGSGYSYSVYGRGGPGSPMRGSSGECAAGPDGGGNGRGAGRAVEPAGSREQEQGQGQGPTEEADVGLSLVGAGGGSGTSCLPAPWRQEGEPPATAGGEEEDPTSADAVGAQAPSTAAPFSSPPPAPLLSQPMRSTNPMPRQLPALAAPPRMSSGGVGGGGATASSPAASSPGGSVRSRPRRASVGYDDWPPPTPPSPSAGSSLASRALPSPMYVPQAGTAPSSAAGQARSAAVTASPSRHVQGTRAAPMPNSSKPSDPQHSGSGRSGEAGLDDSARQSLFSRGAPGGTSPAPESPKAGAARRQRFANLPPPTVSAAGPAAGGAGANGQERQQDAAEDGSTAGPAAGASADSAEHDSILSRMKKALSFLRRAD